MKGYLFAVFLLTISIVFVESAPTQNDEPQLPSHKKLLLRDSVSAPTKNDEPQPPSHQKLLLRDSMSAPTQNDEPQPPSHITVSLRDWVLLQSRPNVKTLMSALQPVYI